MTVLSRPRRSDVCRSLITSAAELFLTQGYAGVTVADVAAHAGFTKGAVYSNFEGKPHLFSAVIEENYNKASSAAVAHAVDALTSFQGQQAAPRLIGAQLAEVAITNGRWQRALAEFRALAARDPQVAQVYSSLRRRQRDDLAEQLAEAGLLAGSDRRAVAALLLGAVGELSTEHAIDPEGMPAPLLRVALTRLIEGLLT